MWYLSKIVIGVHLALLAMLALHHALSFSKPIYKPIQARVTLYTPPKAAIQEPPSLPQKKSGVAKKQPPQEPKIAKKAGTPIHSQWAIALEQACAEIAIDAPAKPRTSLTLPAMVETSPIAIEDNYGEMLASYLQAELELPEYGEVFVELEVSAQGVVKRAAVLSAKSVKNGEFLKNRLIELNLPCFNGNGNLDETRAFTICFKN